MASSSRRACAIAAAIIGMAMTSADANEPALLHAAGSLRGALTEVAEAFAADTGTKVEAKYGPSGTLRDEIAAGSRAQVFASANMEHPQSLATAGRSSPVVLFARNRLCALVKPGLSVTPETLLEIMLREDVKLGTSTPKADPSGDYAFGVFAKAEALKAGSRKALEQKAQQLTGGPSSAPGPAGRSVYGWHVAEGRADIFLTYCTGGLVAQRESPGQQIVSLPEPLAVGADYGMTVMNDSPPAAHRLALFIVSAKGQQILAKHGFSVPALSQGEQR
ncbi:molybdate ABC transporter substrate-binding protein [Bradyrhizobium algeriense]|uniref:molybdate ABC transporter substrate-binding protein n=1 Tax=Bradyrhizobium algeriense TaxID=634784 RepID=UPI000D38E124|nr:molybdate ABC transporter substrate-binding protein [Bradyrhizobium algeriense]